MVNGPKTLDLAKCAKKLLHSSRQVTDVFVSCTSGCYTEEGWAMASSGGGDGSSLYVNALIALFLLIFSGLFSGLTLGLMSLDTVGLKIIAEGAPSAQERAYALKIAPIRKKGNLLLCTLLLGNTLVNAMIAILTADMTSGVLGGLISTFLIVIFGEIIPQAACSRHGLAIGAKCIWLVQIFIVLMFVIAWPISLVLDQVLGSDIGSVYSKNELKELINIHVENPDAAEESGLTRDDQTLITGALEYKDKHVHDVMTSLDMIYMVELNQRLNFQLLFEIYKSGFTRIPVYEGDRQNVVGILFAKGRVQIQAGAEHFTSELGPWTVVGNPALTNEVYYPDFDASMVGPCRILLVRKTAYQMALKICQGEYLSHNQPATSANFSGIESKSEEKAPNLGDGKKEHTSRHNKLSTMSLPVSTHPPSSDNHSHGHHNHSHSLENGIHNTLVDSNLRPSPSEDNLQNMSDQMTNTQWSHSKVFSGKEIAALHASPEPNGREVNNDNLPQHFKSKHDNDNRMHTEGFIFEGLSRPGFDY
ncbi:hypothetical protein CYMTET_26766 [Cymbomonas tetramitiformis]|uniref:CNNM transmembrane domain-containing protein n=1 Tax=Cymbomonas tetramitiformis TaxID=36881 RepID=A0AAE0FRE8_9CHLO|nr:hypothetical protein CYMTET_26766 [Cymbomonas tetramitiformis]